MKRCEISSSIGVVAISWKVTLMLLSLIYLWWIPLASAEDAQSPFYPTWKLLSPAEKQQFLAGYIQGWRDAAKVTDIAISYVKENPAKAVEGLEQIKSLYQLEDMRPALLTSALDAYYSDPKNMNASLSLAISAAKQALGGN